MGAEGNYLPTTTPFGQAAPALPTFYFTDSAAPLSALSSYLTVGQNSYNASSGTDYLTLAANSTVNFSVLVFAGNDVSLSGFGIGFITGTYDAGSVVTPHSTTESHQIGAHIIPALPVPEPETYAMLLVGLMLVGGLSKRSKRSERFS
jgi:hypothetical protein